MKAVVYEGPRQVSTKDVPDAKIERPTDVLVRVTTTNICGSDLHMYEASKGVVAQRYPYNYQQGLGTEQLSELDRAVHSNHAISGEVNARAFYRRWAEFVDNLSWEELMDLARSDDRIQEIIRREDAAAASAAATESESAR